MFQSIVSHRSIHSSGRHGQLVGVLLAATVALGAALGPMAESVLGYTTAGPGGSTISSPNPTVCDNIFNPSGPSWRVREMTGSFINFPYGTTQYRTARRTVTLQYSPNGTTNWTSFSATYEDARITYTSVMSGFPVFSFSPLTISVTPGTGVTYIRVLDTYALYTTSSAVGMPAWQSPNWIRDGYQSAVWDGVSTWSPGFTYFGGPCRFFR